jgi:hypothetical protein
VQKTGFESKGRQINKFKSLLLARWKKSCKSISCFLSSFKLFDPSLVKFLKKKRLKVKYKTMPMIGKYKEAALLSWRHAHLWFQGSEVQSPVKAYKYAL